MTKLEMVRAIINPNNRAQEDYAEHIAKSMTKGDIELHYKWFIKSGCREGYRIYKLK